MAKLAEYAEVGIAHYLIVDPGPPVTTTALRLADGAYRPTVPEVERATVVLGGVEVVIDPA